MPTKFAIDWCPHSRLDELQAFIGRDWKAGHVLARDAELLRWQYIHPERPEHFSILIAEDHSEIVGMLGVILLGFAHEGRRYPGATLALWIAREKFRGEGLGLQLLHKLLGMSYPFVDVMGSNSTALAILKLLRFAIHQRIPRWARAFSVNALESLLAEDGQAYSAAARSEWTETGRAGPSPPHSSAIRVLDWSDSIAPAWDQAWRERFSPKIRGAWRNSEFLRWRYVDHPRFSYRIRFAADAATGNILGLLVFRLAEIQNRSERVLRIVEFLATDAPGQILADEVCRIGLDEQVAFADFYCTSEHYSECLRQAGFVREDSRSTHLPALFSPLDFRRTALTAAFSVSPEIAPDSNAYFASDQVYFTRSDGDQDRPN